MPYENIFVWNAYLTQPIRSRCKNTIWTIALVHGHFKQVFESLQSSSSAVASLKNGFDNATICFLHHALFVILISFTKHFIENAFPFCIVATTHFILQLILFPCLCSPFYVLIVGGVILCGLMIADQAIHLWEGLQCFSDFQTLSTFCRNTVVSSLNLDHLSLLLLLLFCIGCRF